MSLLAAKRALLDLSEPELWAALRAYDLVPTAGSPLAEMARAGATLNELLAHGRTLLENRGLAVNGRVNRLLGAALKALAEPDEAAAITERAGLGTRIRRFWGRQGLFVEHITLPGLHTIGFPFTRAQIAFETARALGLSTGVEAGR